MCVCDSLSGSLWASLGKLGMLGEAWGMLGNDSWRLWEAWGMLGNALGRLGDAWGRLEEFCVNALGSLGEAWGILGNEAWGGLGLSGPHPARR